MSKLEWIKIILIFFGLQQVGIAQNVIYIDEQGGQVEKTAAELAIRLEDATRQTFSVETGNGFTKKGIYITTKKEHLPEELKKMGTEAFFVKGNAKNIIIGGNSILSLQNGINSYLEELGFRFYFPHPNWHIIPNIKNIYINVNKLSEPKYQHRRIWYASGTDSKEADVHYSRWVKLNSLGGALQINTGHTYQSIIKRNKEEFRKHPDYFALKENGTRETEKTANAKFCFSNKGLMELCKRDVLNQIAKAEKTSKPLQMVSMDPSDGWNTCHCDNCKKLGSTSDRVFYLANEVAKTVKKEYPNKWIGLYAYANHAEPTTIDLEDNIFVLVATAFNKTKYSTDELIREWGKIASKIGIRDYYGVIAWDWDMPGRIKGGNIERISSEIPKYAAMGAIAMSAETNIGWISRGLGHYVAAKKLWDTNIDTHKITEDFFEKAFGKAKEPMKELHKAWSNNTDEVPSDQNLGKWLDLAEQGYKQSTGEASKRVLDYIYYLHYVVLYKNYKEYNSKDNPHKAYLELLNYVWRVKEMEVCSSFPLIRRLAGGRAPLPEYSYKNPDCTWKKNSDPISKSEILNLFEDDRKKFQVVTGVEEKSYSSSMRKVENIKTKNFGGNLYRGGLTIYLKKEIESGSFKVSLGYVSTGKREGLVNIFEIGDDGEETLVETKKIPMDKKFHTIYLNYSSVNYKITINDYKAGIMVSPDDSTPLSISASPKSKVNSSRRSNFYFFVPTGTKKFIIQRNGPITLKSPSGKILKYENNKNESLQITSSGNDNGIWEILNQSGSFYFIGIPPFVSISSQNLLIPENIE